MSVVVALATNGSPVARLSPERRDNPFGICIKVKLVASRFAHDQIPTRSTDSECLYQPNGDIDVLCSGNRLCLATASGFENQKASVQHGRSAGPQPPLPSSRSLRLCQLLNPYSRAITNWMSAFRGLRDLASESMENHRATAAVSPRRTSRRTYLTFFSMSLKLACNGKN